MTNQILDTKAIEMLELTDQDLMAVNGGGLGSVAKIIFKGTRNALAYEAATNIVGDAING